MITCRHMCKCFERPEENQLPKNVGKFHERAGIFNKLIREG